MDTVMELTADVATELDAGTELEVTIELTVVDVAAELTVTAALDVATELTTGVELDLATELVLMTEVTTVDVAATLEVFDVHLGKVVAEQHISPVMDLVTFVGDASFVVSNPWNRLELHNLPSEVAHTSAPRTFDPCPTDLTDDIVVLSALDRRTLLSCTTSGEVQIWDLENLSYRGAFRSGSTRIYAVASIDVDAPGLTTGQSCLRVAIASSTGLEIWQIYEDTSPIFRDGDKVGPSRQSSVGNDAHTSTNSQKGDEEPGLPESTKAGSHESKVVSNLAEYVEGEVSTTTLHSGIAGRTDEHEPAALRTQQAVIVDSIARAMNLLLLSFVLAMVPH
ncbi:hypothetical protein C2E23DRAFT_882472 [Lenzites betulinus]|nr:hypothetical protein C2E23DRAFT_882472 [Lenzites betulinus]